MRAYQESLEEEVEVPVPEEPAPPAPVFSPASTMPPAAPALAPPASGPTEAEFKEAIEKLETGMKEVAGSTRFFYGKIWKPEGLQVYTNPPGKGDRHEVVHTYQPGSYWPKLCYPIIKIKSTGDSWMKTEWVTSDGSLNSGWVRVTNGVNREVPFSDYSIHPQDDVTEARITSLESKLASLTSTLAELHEHIADIQTSAPMKPTPPPPVASTPRHTFAGAPAKPSPPGPKSYFGLPSMPSLPS